MLQYISTTVSLTVKMFFYAVGYNPPSPIRETQVYGGSPIFKDGAADYTNVFVDLKNLTYKNSPPLVGGVGGGG